MNPLELVIYQTCGIHYKLQDASMYIPYDSLSSVHFQIGIWSPKQHLFDRKFCVGLLQTVCKQWLKGHGKIP
jgi:hypothetical protein